MVNEAYTNLVEFFAAAAKKDLEEATSALERSGLEMLLDGGPYDQDNDPTIYDLLRFAKRVAESHEHATYLRAAVESATHMQKIFKTSRDVDTATEIALLAALDRLGVADCGPWYLVHPADLKVIKCPVKIGRKRVLWTAYRTTR